MTQRDSLKCLSTLRALSHEATFTGNLEATNCMLMYKNTLVAHESFFKQCLYESPGIICKHSNVSGFSSWRLPGKLELVACKLPRVTWPLSCVRNGIIFNRDHRQNSNG